MLSLPLLLLIIGIAAIAAFWQSSLGARELANRAAQNACSRQQVQFLDGTVAFARISLTRDAGRLALRRTYVFDYSTASIERCQGFVMLLGQRVESIGFAPDRDTDHPSEIRLAEPAVEDDKNTPDRYQDSKVLDLAEWRKRRLSKPVDSRPEPEDSNSGDQGW